MRTIDEINSTYQTLGAVNTLDIIHKTDIEKISHVYQGILSTVIVTIILVIILCIILSKFFKALAYQLFKKDKNTKD